jgi:hypothetical protein
VAHNPVARIKPQSPTGDVNFSKENGNYRVDLEATMIAHKQTLVLQRIVTCEPKNPPAPECIDAGCARDNLYADWSRGEGIRRLNSGRAYSGLLRFAPGLGKASRMLTGDSLGRARMRVNIEAQRSISAHGLVPARSTPP